MEDNIMGLDQISYNSPSGAVAPGLHREVINCGSTKTLVAADSGALIMLDQADGSVLTLPTPVAGMQFDVAVKVAVTSNSHIIKTGIAASEFIGGGMQQMIAANAVSEGQAANGTDDVTITMNGTTTGGLIGTLLRFIAISATRWEVSGLIMSSGTLTTPVT
jgi:hypothetical protein